MLKPFDDRVVIKPDDGKSVTEGGILLPDSAKEKPTRGTVLAVGPGRIESGQRISMSCKVGDRVIFDGWQATDLDLDGDKVKVLHQSAIIGIIQKD